MDIHCYVEKRHTVKRNWQIVKSLTPFKLCNYSLFSFLAGLRNEIGCEPLDYPRGLPVDVSEEVQAKFEENKNYHSASHFTLQELREFDYSKTFYNEREGRTTTYKKTLGKWFFRDLSQIEGNEGSENARIVFWFED